MRSEQDWRNEDNARVLMRAEEIKANAKEYAGAKKVLAKQAAAINKVVKPATRRK